MALVFYEDSASVAFGLRICLSHRSTAPRKPFRHTGSKSGADAPLTGGECGCPADASEDRGVLLYVEGHGAPLPAGLQLRHLPLSRLQSLLICLAYGC